ncbi:MAG TPA: DUF3866 family protein [Capillimicrobium sp.]|jgi:hypothetical protein
MLELRRTTVTAADGDRGWCETGLGRAWSDPALHPLPEPGDEVVVNVQARALGLGSGGYDVVAANLTRGLGHAEPRDRHVMKLNYTPLQHAVHPADGDPQAARASGAPVAVFPLHGHLPTLAWALAQAAPGARLGYVQTAGGALPGTLSRAVAELRERGWLHAHVTAGPAYGGEAEAISTAGAIAAAAQAGCDAVACGPGPGILGSGTALGHGGLAALDSAHAALALGLPTLLVARMSEADPRERHLGLSHHTRTVLDLLLAPVTVALPSGQAPPPQPGAHAWRSADGSLEGHPWPLRTMGREDPLFFAAAAAAGRQLAAMMESL